MTCELQDVENALRFIPPDDRDIWIRVGMAIKSELEEDGFPIWDEWSQSAGNYKQADARAVWKSLFGDN